MPPAPVCVKCKTSSAAEGDSWCNGCSAWEFIGRELSASWDTPGGKLLANDIAVSAARQIRAVRSLTAGLVRQSIPDPSAGGSRASGERPEPTGAGGGERETLPRRRSVVPPPPASKEEPLTEEEEDESEEYSVEADHIPLPGGDRKPPEPEGPPPGRPREKRGAGEDRASSRHEGSRRSRKHRRSSGHRGGRKHQRLQRLADNPNLVIHRKPGSGFWELASSGRRGHEHTFLGRWNGHIHWGGRSWYRRSGMGRFITSGRKCGRNSYGIKFNSQSNGYMECLPHHLGYNRTRRFICAGRRIFGKRGSGYRGHNGYSHGCWWSRAPMPGDAVHRTSSFGRSSTCYKDQIMAMEHGRGLVWISHLRGCWESEEVDEGNSRCEKGGTWPQGESSHFKAKNNKTCSGKGTRRTGKEGSWKAWVINWTDRRDEEAIEIQVRRSEAKGSWSQGRRWTNGPRSHRSLGRFRSGVKQWASAYVTRGRGSEAHGGDWPGGSSRGAGSSRALKGSAWEETRQGGYKRAFFEELDESIDSAGSGHESEAAKWSRKEEEAEKVKGVGCLQAAGSDPYQKQEGKVEVEEEGKGREEKEEDGGWSDCELQFLLTKHFSSDLGQRLRHRHGDAYEKEVEGQAGERAVIIDGACPGANGPGGVERCSGSGSSSHQWHQDPELFFNAHQASIPRLHAGVERDAYIGSNFGSPPLGGHRPGGGQPQCEVHGDTPEYDRPELEHCKVHGIAQHGGRQCGVSITGVGLEKTLKAGRKSARKRMELLGKCRAPIQGERKRRPQRLWWRWQGRKRKRETSQGQRRSRLGEKSERLGQNPGEGRREGESLRWGSLDESVRAEREEYLKTIGVRRVLDHCTTLRSVGCALAWCVGNALDISTVQGNRSFQSGIFSSGVWHKAVRQRAALPMCEGEFSGLLAVSRSISLEDTADENHQKLWAKLSWQMVSCFACNSLMGESCPFKPGKWTGVEKKLAIAVAQSVDRFASHGQELDVDVKEVEKDLNSKRVGYSGEEIGVCTTLTLKQVIPALPPCRPWRGYWYFTFGFTGDPRFAFTPRKIKSVRCRTRDAKT